MEINKLPDHSFQFVEFQSQSHKRLFNETVKVHHMPAHCLILAADTNTNTNTNIHTNTSTNANTNKDTNVSLMHHTATHCFIIEHGTICCSSSKTLQECETVLIRSEFCLFI